MKGETGCQINFTARTENDNEKNGVKKGSFHNLITDVISNGLTEEVFFPSPPERS